MTAEHYSSAAVLLRYSDSPAASRAPSLLAKGSIRTILPSRNVSTAPSEHLRRPDEMLEATCGEDEEDR